MKKLTKTILSLFCATSMVLSSGCSALNDLLGNLGNASSSTENSLNNDSVNGNTENDSHSDGGNTNGDSSGDGTSDDGDNGETETINMFTGIFAGNYREVSLEEFVELSLNTKEEETLEQILQTNQLKFTNTFYDTEGVKHEETEVYITYLEETNSYRYSSVITDYWTTTEGKEKTLKTYNYSDGYQSYRKEFYGLQGKKVALDYSLLKAFGNSRYEYDSLPISPYPLKAFLNLNFSSLQEWFQLLVDDTDERYIKLCIGELAMQVGFFWIYDKNWNLVGNYTGFDGWFTKFEPLDGTIELPDDLDTYSTEDNSNWDFEMGNEVA